MKLIDITNSHSQLVNEQLANTDAFYIKVYSLGQTTVFYADAATHRDIVILNKKRRIKDVEIEFDVYQKEDKYHRALCYVYADGKNVQEELLVAGLAEIKYVKPPDTRYLEKYKKAQNKAKSNKRNLWSGV